MENPIKMHDLEGPSFQALFLQMVDLTHAQVSLLEPAPAGNLLWAPHTPDKNCQCEAIDQHTCSPVRFTAVQRANWKIWLEWCQFLFGFTGLNGLQISPNIICHKICPSAILRFKTRVLRNPWSYGPILFFHRRRTLWWTTHNSTKFWQSRPVLK